MMASESQSTSIFFTFCVFPDSSPFIHNLFLERLQNHEFPVFFVNSKTLTRNTSKIALQEIVKSGKSVKNLLDEMDLNQVSDSSEIESIIMQVFDEEKQAVLDAKENPETVNYLVGKVMQKTKGKADPTKTLELIKSKL